MQLEIPAISELGLWRRILEAVNDICQVAGSKDVTDALDVSPSQLSHMRCERNGNDFKLKHLPSLLRLRHNDDLPRAIARAAGLELAPPTPLTPAQQLERIQAALSRAGAAGQAILDDAFGRRR